MLLLLLLPRPPPLLVLLPLTVLIFVPALCLSQAAVILNLTPDHLERHGSMDAYGAAKCRMFARMEPSDVAIIPQGMYACQVGFVRSELLLCVIGFISCTPPACSIHGAYTYPTRCLHAAYSYPEHSPQATFMQSHVANTQHT